MFLLVFIFWCLETIPGIKAYESLEMSDTVLNEIFVASFRQRPVDWI